MRVIYLWRGERYVHSRDPQTISEAKALVNSLRKNGWTAWYET